MRKHVLIKSWLIWLLCAPTAFGVSPEQSERLSQGEVISEIEKGEKGLIEVFGAVDISASPETIWRLMTDCDAQFDIIPDLKSCEILGHSPDKRWDIRRQIIKLGFPLPNARSEFRSDYVPFEKITISRTGGDLSLLEGEWALELRPSEQTRVTYQARMKSRLPVPARFIRRGVKRDMPLILQNLRERAEGLQNSGPTEETP